ncbi:MAG: SufE family protein [Rhodothermia bacterium]|nr:SufE family protein [Rhodothermia bacterium]
MSESTSIRERERQIVDEFSMFDDWMGRYEYLIELGSDLPLIEDRYKTDEFKIKGCQSQVWLRPDYRNGRVYFRADSDAVITKGLIALLVRVLDGELPADIATAPLRFIDEIGMKEHLSSTRKNGLASMIRQIRSYASSVTAEA